jgi:NAD(P)-dependent dehydrogenase (short-subunit alcohol dehydrogenase family)
MKTIVITGSASGIGLELTRQLHERGEKVYAVCRKPTPELKSIGAQVIDGIELTDDHLEHLLKKWFKDVQIDWLLNNAGIFELETLEKMSLGQVRRQFEVNTIAPLRVTEALLPQLKNGAKIGITTSRMGSIEDNTSGGYYGYRMSKAAVNMLGKTLAMDLKPKNISVALMHPGYVKTKMTQQQGEITPDVSVQGLIKILDQLSLDSSGGFWHTNGERLPW